MTNDARHRMAAAEKTQLIADGALYRLGLLRAKVQLTQNLRPDTLWHGALSQALVFAGARVEQLLAPGGVRLQTVMPYVLAGLSMIARKKIIKPALGAGVIVALAIGWLVRRKRS